MKRLLILSGFLSLFLSASGQGIRLLPGGTYKLDSAGILRSTDLTQEFQIWDNPSQYEVRIIRSSRDTAMPKLAIYKSGLPLVVAWKNRIAVMGDTLQAVRALSWAIIRLDSLHSDWQNRALPSGTFVGPFGLPITQTIDTVQVGKLFIGSEKARMMWVPHGSKVTQRRSVKKKGGVK